PKRPFLVSPSLNVRIVRTQGTLSPLASPRKSEKSEDLEYLAVINYEILEYLAVINYEDLEIMRIFAALKY
ncbi:MAG: hypothetical protein IIT83_04105, partial [Bacteroidales bacterium]|nr:hypothetical protein [Bacteroidales bacterium]